MILEAIKKAFRAGMNAGESTARKAIQEHTNLPLSRADLAHATGRSIDVEVTLEPPSAARRD